jgi:hypothetical protein
LNSLIWHILISILIFLVLKKLSKNFFIALIAALIFAAHPIHTERVTNMTGGFDLLGIFFILLSFYAYILYAEKNKRHLLVLSLTAFIAGLFSSEEELTLPLIIAVYEVILNNFNFSLKENKDKLVRIFIFFAILAIFVYFRVFVLGIGAREEVYSGGTFYTTMLTMIKVFFYYMVLIFFPFNLTLYREIQISESFFEPIILFSFIILAALLLIGVKFYKKYKMFSFAIFWFFIRLLPFSNIVPIQTFIADRYLYVASMSAAIIYSLILFRLFS